MSLDRSIPHQAAISGKVMVAMVAAVAVAAAAWCGGR